MGFRVVIPARFASTRLPGKPLADIGGKAMVVRVLERARAAGADDIWVATDHADVAAVVQAEGGQAMLTRSDHPSGTDRIAELAGRLGWSDEDVVVNVQGDEPLIDPALISLVARALSEDPGAAMATASHAIRAEDEIFNPNFVKVVCDRQGRALYFSRAPIPWARDAFGRTPRSVPDGLEVQRHVGIYAYRCAFLRIYSGLSESPLERWESLEQLRALWHGHRIVVRHIDSAPEGGVDTEADLIRVRAMFDRLRDSG